MKSNNFFVLVFKLLAILLVMLLPQSIFAQMSPHPSLAERFQKEKGIASKSFYLQNYSSFEKRGIDAPWTSPNLNVRKSYSDKAFQRSYGPEKSPSGAWKALVLLVKFSDKPSQVVPNSFDELLFGTSFGSMRDYYKKVSYNNLDIVTVNLPSSVGWLTASQTYSYYVDNQNGFGTYPKNAQKLVEEVVNLANPSVDFSKYDNDSDGYVDALFVVHTGPGAEYTGSNADIWSHAWVTNSEITVDGVKVFRYSMEPEYWANPGDMTMGVYAHELGHSGFGVPDLYDRDYSSRGLGKWSLMAGGSWNGTGVGGNYPAMPDAWIHAQMGYVVPTVVTSNLNSLQFTQIETNSKAYLIWKNSPVGQQYFLVENRQKVDYDQYLPGDGLLVYHIDEAVGGYQNDREWYPGLNIANHYLVALEQADGLWNLEKGYNSGDAADPFPGSGNKNEFSYSTAPNTNDYTNSFTGIKVKNISNSSATMTGDLEINNDVKILTVLFPNGYETLKPNKPVTIRWNSLNVANVKLEYTANNGTSWNEISASTAASAMAYVWTTPSGLSNQCKIRISDVTNSALNDVSDNVFYISDNVNIAESEPNNSTSESNYIAYADTISGSISPVGDVDYFKFDGTANDTVVVFAKVRNTSQIDGRVRLYDSGGVLIADNDDYFDFRRSKIIYILPTTGTYYVRYSYFTNTAGSPQADINGDLTPGNSDESIFKHPNLGTYDEGDYNLYVVKYKKSAPTDANVWLTDLNYNSTRFSGEVTTNGLPTSVTIQYGVTSNLGSSLVVSNNAFSLDTWGFTSSPLTGLTANTKYFYRVVLQNGLGTYNSNITEFTTPLTSTQWVTQNSNVTSQLNSINFKDENTGVITGPTSILTTINGGAVWENKYPQEMGSLTVWDSKFVGAKIFATLNNSKIITSTDMGTSWTSLQVSNWSNIYSIHFIDNNTGVLSNGGGEIWKTTDGGANWSIIRNAEYALYDVKMINANLIVAVGTGNRFVKSTDGGSTWTASSIGSYSRVNAVEFVNANIGYAVNERQILKTIDGGTTWTDLNYGNLTYSYRKPISLIDANNVLVVGQNGIILKTADGGANWERMVSGTTNYLLAAKLLANNKAWAAGEWGKVLTTQKYLSVTDPNGNEKWGVGNKELIKWSSGGVANVNIEYSVNNGTNWSSVATNISAALAQYEWTIPNGLSSSCLIRISDASNAAFNDVSDNLFSIVNFPKVVITPELFELKSVPGDSVTTQLNIKNDGSGNLSWAINKPIVETSPQIELQLEQIKQSITERAVLSYEGETILNGYQKIEYRKDAIVRIFKNPNLNNSGMKIALLSCAGSVSYDNDVANKLLATGKFSVITAINCNAATPTLTELKLFDAVLVYSNAPFLNEVEFGNNLAGYADGGGGVVLSMFSMVTQVRYTPGGKFTNTKYLCVPNSEPLFGPSQTLGQIFDANDSILQGVTSFNGGPLSYRPSIFTVNAGTKRIANWSDGSPLIVSKMNNEVSRADIYFFPPSSDVSSDCWQANTDGAKILANALVAVSKTASWLTYTPESGTVNPSANTNVTIKASAKNLQFGSYGTKITLNTNDPLKRAINVPIAFDLKGLRITSPNGGEVFKAGTTKNIKWQASAIDKIKIELSENNGTTWNQIATDITASTGVYQFTVPNTQSDNCLIKISDVSDPLFNDKSDAVFKIIKYGAISEIEPNNTRETSNQIAYADTVDAAVSPVNDIDYYTFEGAAGDTVMIYGEKRGTTNSLEGRISLINEAGNYLYENTNFLGTSQKQRVVFVLPTSGNYYVRYSYRNNWNGIPPAEKEKYEQEKKAKELRGELEDKGPELGTYDEGEYRLVLNLFKKSAPQFAYTYTDDRNFNSTRFYGLIYPNAVPTTIKIDYGTTNSYGSTNTISNVNSLNDYYFTTEKLTGLTANTVYHYKVTLTNAYGIYESVDNTFVTPLAPDGWAYQNSGVTNTLNAIKYFDANVGYAVGYGVIIKTTDGGNTWVTKKTSGDYKSLEVLDANTVVAVGYQNIVSKTTDGGTTWTNITPTNCYGIMSVSFKDANNGVLVTYCGEMYKTTDGGSTWASVSISATHQDLLTVKYFNNNTIIAAGWNRYVIRSTDGGTTWSGQQLSGSSYAIWSMSFKDDNNGIMVGYRGMTFKTVDGGANWTSINAGHTNYQYGVNYQSNGTIITVGEQGIIYKSGDDGLTWTRQQSGTTNYLYGINTIGNSSTSMAVGNWGTILKSQDYLQLVSPNGNEQWKEGTQRIIRWSSNGIANVRIGLTTNNGTNWSEIVASTPAAIGKYLWTVPTGLSTQCKIKVTNTTNASMSDESNGVFSIIKPGPIAEIEPNNTLALANAIAYTDTVDAAIAPVNDIDYYTFEGAAGDTVMIYGEKRGTTNSLEGRISLINQDGNYLYENTNFLGTSQKQRVVFVLPISGNYYVRYAYRNNWSGIEKPEEPYDPKEELRERLLNKGPQLGTYDEGEYRLILNLFKKTAPQFNYTSLEELNYNSARFYSQLYPNGSPTKVTIEYGTTTSYGSSVVAATDINSISIVGLISPRVTGLNANTLYHFRTKLENSYGVFTSGDYTFTTPETPDGWVIQNSGTDQHIYDVDFFDDSNGIAVTEYNGILKTTDGGTTWTNVFPSGQPSFYGRGIDYVTSSKIVTVGNARIMLSNDGGASWTSNQVGGYYFTKVSFSDENNGLAIDERGRIYKTTDGGTTWTEKYYVGHGSSGWSVDYFNVNLAVVTGPYGFVLKTTDGGNTWTDIYTPTNYFYGVDVIDANTYMAVGDYFVAKSTDGGTTWTSTNPQGYFSDVKFTDANNGRIVGDRIFVTKDGGATWTQEKSGTSNHLFGISNPTTAKTVLVGIYGTILKSQDYLQLVSPNGGENWKAGIQKKISWSSGGVENVKIEYSANNGSTWTDIIATTPSSGSYMWTVPNNIGSQNKIRITSTTNASLTDVSDAAFNIIPVGPIAEIEPNNTRDASAMSVAYSDTVNAAISPINDVDYYRINGVAGDTLMVYSERRGTSQLNGRIRLYNNNGGWYVENPNYGEQGKQRIVYVLPYTGEYYLRYSYQDNYSGIEKPALQERYDKNGRLIEHGPELGTYDEGEYRISFDTFKKSAPVVQYSGLDDLNYNSVRFIAGVFPNGLPTKITFEYGTTTSYGSSIVLTENSNGVSTWENYHASNPVINLLPNTLYHFRAIVQNALGSVTTQDNMFTTPAAPVGWVAQNSGVTNSLYAVDYLNETVGYAAGTGVIIKTVDGGTTWTKVIDGISTIRAIDAVDDNNIYAAGYQQQIYKSADGGTTWTQKTIGNCYAIFDISFNDVNNGFVVTECGSMYKTVDGGNNWTQVTLPTTDQLYAVKMISASRILAIGGNRRILISNDGGATWNSQQFGNFNYWHDIAAIDQNNIVISGEGNQAAKTEDGGTTWLMIRAGDGGYWESGVAARSLNEIYLVNGPGRLYHTKNGGTSWSQDLVGTQNSLNDISLVGSKVIAVGGWGTILKSTDYLKVVSPNGGEHFKIGTTREIRWTSGGTENVKIEQTTNNGTNWSEIIASTPATSGKYLWTVPNTPSTQCKIKVTNTTNTTMYDESDGQFSIGTTDETVAYWKLDEASGVSVRDSSGYGNHGTADASLTIVDGLFGKAKKAPMATNKNGVVVPNSSSLNITGNKPITIETFIKLNGHEQNGIAFVQKKGNYGLGLGSYSSAGFLQLFLWQDLNNAYVLQSPEKMPTNRWVHVAGTWDGVNAKLYVDYKLVRSTNYNNGIAGSTEPLYLASTGLDIVPTTETLIDEIKITNLSLEPKDFQQFPKKFVDLLSPNGGEVFKWGTTREIKWYSSGVENAKIELSTNNGSNWSELAASTPAAIGKYAWTLPSIEKDSLKIRISDVTDPTLFDMSSNRFKIIKNGPITENEPNNLKSEANAIAYADTIDGAITPINDIDYYKFEGAAGDTVMVYGEKKGTTNSIEGRIRLLDQNGNFLYERTSFLGTSQKQRVVYVLPNTSTYYVRYSYRNNYNGMPPEEVEKIKQEEKEKELKGEKSANGPELGTYDEGEYRLILSRFKKTAPQFVYTYPDDINFNSVRLFGLIYPNGSPTTIKIEYGTTNSYGSLYTINDANSLNEFYFTTEKLTGLTANTVYHYKVKLTSAFGSNESGDNTFMTPPAPVGWTAQNSGITNWLYTTDFVNENLGFAAGDGNILKTINGGTSWTVVKNGINSIRAIDAVDANNIYAVGYSNQLWKSSDGGATWNASNPTNCYSIIGVSFFDLNNGVVVTECGTMYKTVNGGGSWAQVTEPITEPINDVTMLSLTKIVAVGGNRRVIISNDGGNTWTNQQLGGNYYAWWEVAFADANNGMTVGQGGMKAKTIDGGTTWTVLDQGGNSPFLWDVTAKSATEYYAVGDGGTIQKTIDGGANWTGESSGTQNSLRGISAAGTKLVVVGGWGTVLKSVTPEPTGVAFKIDMRLPIKQGTLDKATGKVYLAGDFNGWSTQNELTGPAADSTYSIDMQFTTGQLIHYKFLYQNKSGGLTWEDSFNTPSTNRETTITDTTHLVKVNWNDKDPNTPLKDGSLTFVCDMSVMKEIGLFDTAQDSLKIRGSFNGWNDVNMAHSLMTQDPSIPTNYSITIPIVKEELNKKEDFKFFLSNKVQSGAFVGDHRYERPMLFGGGNRSTQFLGQQNQQVPKVYFNDILPDYVIPSGKTVSITLKVDMSPAMDPTKQSPVFEPAKDTVYLVPGQAAWAQIMGWQDEQDRCLKLNPIGNNIYSVTIKIKGPAFNGFTYGYEFGKQNPAGLVREQLTSGAVNGFRVRYIAMYGARKFAQPYTAPTDTWTNAVVKTDFEAAPQMLTNPYTWTNDITVKDKGNGSEILSFGTASTATDGIDTGLGESVLPPAPPTGVFDARLVLPNEVESSLRDFRKDGQENTTWKITYQPSSSGYPMTFTWDKTAFPQEGNFMLTDELDGIVVNVDMKINDSYELKSGSIKTLLVKYSKMVKANVNLVTNWNILSVPVKAANMNTTVLFPDFKSPTYSYDNGYKAVTLLENGKGYWLSYKKDSTIVVSGDKVNKNTVAVKNGWNLIGPYDWEALVSGITTSPTGILNSQFYEYKGGYIVPVKLVPGKGYWIRVNADGELILPPASSTPIMAKVSDEEAVSGKDQTDVLRIRVADSKGGSSELNLMKNIASIEKYDLPPMPPRGIFEVRWSSDRKVEKRGNGIGEIVISSADYPVTINVTGGDIRVKDNIGGIVVNQILRRGETLQITNKAIERVTIEELEIPTEFKLLQNYPNPFNPETKIEYWLPEAGKVTLKIYDVLGREVETLVDQNNEAGKYEVRWNASKYSSGVYFYNINTKNNHSVKKMLLIK